MGLDWRGKMLEVVVCRIDEFDKFYVRKVGNYDGWVDRMSKFADRRRSVKDGRIEEVRRVYWMRKCNDNRRIT